MTKKCSILPMADIRYRRQISIKLISKLYYIKIWIFFVAFI